MHSFDHGNACIFPIRISMLIIFQCHFDPNLISQQDFLSVLMKAENALPDTLSDMIFSGRRITFPIVLDDTWCQDAILRYMKTSRTKAVYLPSNIEYLARNNGLIDSRDALQKLVQSDHVSHHSSKFSTLKCSMLIIL